MSKIFLSNPISVRFLVFSVFLFFQLGVEANFLGIPEISYYNRRAYNGATQNWKISQADNGLIYAANNDGVMEFDGSLWRHLPKAVDAVTRSVLAFQNRIYFGAYNEFGYYQLNGVNDYKYHSLSKTSELSSLGDLWNIIPFNDAIVFQAHKGLVIFKDPDVITFIPSKSRITNAFLVNGMFLVYDELGGLMELRQGKLFEIPGGDIFAGVSIGAIMPISDKEILIGTITQGLYIWDMRTFRPWISPSSDFLKNANIFCGLTNTDGEFVFGTIQSGVVVTDKQGNIQLVASKDKGLQNNTVLSLETDKEGNIWAGLDNGIARISYNSSVSFLQGYYNLGTGYALEKLENSVFLGTNQGLFHIDEPNFRDALKDKNNFFRIPGTSGQVWTIFIDHDKQLLCGHNSGVFVIEGRNSRLITPPSIVGAWIFRYPPNRNDLLLVGSYNGLILLKKENGQWVFKKRLEGFDESSRYMEWDTKDGGLWISHGYQGIFKIHLSNDFEEITRVQVFDKARGLEDNSSLIVSLVNGEVVFSSSKGIYGYDLAAESFYRHKWNSYFLQNDYPFYLVGDKYNNIWFFAGSEAGVLRRLEDGNFTKVVNSFFNLKGKLVSGFEFVKILDERNAIFGIEDGFAHYLVKEGKDFSIPFNVHIREFRSFNDKTTYYYSSSPENQNVIPSFTYSNNSFEVTISATGFENPFIQYSTYLEGFDAEWQPYSISRKRQFTKIKEGTYVFWVKAINIQGVETAAVGFKFVVQPPWFRTNLAKAFYLLLLIVITVGAWKLLNWLIDRSRLLEIKKQKEAFRITEEQLKNKALESEKEMIRLRNEKLNSDMVYKEKELANSTMHIIQKNEFLQKIKDELIKMVKYRELDNLDKRVNSLVHKIDKDIDNDAHWEVFEIHLEQVHEDFLKRLRAIHPDLSAKELKLSAYLRMNMSSKEISSLMNISVRAVENNRYKLRKKLNLDGKDNLIDYILAI